MKQYKIAHFADVHFRGLTRHDEYVSVFKQAFEKMRQSNLDAIFISGDIVHTKTQGISPEIIEILTWWFNQMAAIAPTYVFLGNHDGLIHNSDRQDAITPIISAIGNPRLKLFKKSGNYETHMPGVRIANFSCFDEEGWKDVTTEGEIVISVFHGAVRGSLTDADFPTEGEVDLSLFKGCHFGLFGDIHKHQFLDSENRFAYPGSTIQQNYGEHPAKGYLVWSIRSKDDFDVERVILKNPHPFVTINWSGVDSTIASISKKLVGARFRISSDKMLAQDEIKQISSFLKDEMKSHEIVWKWDTENDRSTITSDVDINRKSLRDPETHREFLAPVFKDNPEELKNGVDTIKTILSSIEEDDTVRNQKWSISKMSWDNTFGYGKGNEINFNALSGIIGLFGVNRIGKSSIPGTLMYSLFNDTDRGSISNLHIVNTRKGYCQAAVEFSVAGVPYKVERQTIKHSNKKGQVSASTQLNLFQLNESGDTQSDLSGEQRRESERLLRKLIGTSEDFLLTSFAAQGEMNNFIRLKASARKLLLSKFLDLQVLDSIHVKLKEEASSFKSALKTMPNINFRLQRESYENSIINIDSEIFKIEQEIKDSTSLKEQIEIWIRDHGGNAAKHFSISDIKEIERKIFDTKNNLNKQNKILEDLDTSLKDTTKKSSSIKFLKENFPIKENEQKVQEFELLEKNSVKAGYALEKENDILKNQEKSIAKLNDVPCGEQFPSCKFIKDSIRDKKLIDEQRKTIQELKSQIKQMNSEMSEIDIDEIKEMIRKYNAALSKEKVLNSDILRIESNINLAKNNIQKYSEDLVKLNLELENAKMNMSDSDEVEIMSSKRRKLDEISQKIRSLNSSLVTQKSNLAVTKEKINNLNNEEKRFNSISASWNFYNTLASVYNKDGIPMTIVKKELPRINNEISKILQGVAGFTVSFETDEECSDLDIFIDYGDSKRPIELGSGMEKMLSALAIRVALINVSSLPKSDIIIIDEGFGALDEQNIEACNRLLRSLKRFFKTVIVISHVDAVKDAVDGFIEITNRGQDSYVVSADSVSDSE